MPTTEKRTPTSNNSQTNRTRILSSRELATFKRLNPYLPQGGRYNFEQSSNLITTLGGVLGCCDNPVVNNDPVLLTVPDAPTSVSATEGDTEATIDFTAPVNDGGSSIISYRVTSSPGGITATGSSSPITITGLTNGISYTFTVIATNSVGNSIPSTVSNSVVHMSVPGSPTSVSASYGDAQSVISFTAPVNNGGSPITSYTVTSNPGGFTATGSSSPITITGLTNGVSYTYTVVATNSVGDSPPSSASSSITAGDDAIILSLSTSLTDYQAAADDDWVKITSTEYANLQTNISGTVKAGITDDYLTTSNYSGLANSGSAVVANSVTVKSPAIPANSYLYAFSVRWVTAIPTENMCVFSNTNSSSGGGFNQVGSTLPATTAEGLSYYVRKGVSTTNGSTSGLLACFTGTKLDYPNPSFTGSSGYIGFKYLAGTSPIPNMRYLIGGNTIPGPNVTLTGNLGGYGAFAIQGLTTNTIQWI